MQGIADDKFISAEAAERLIAAHDGDVALLYLYIRRYGADTEGAARALCRTLGEMEAAHEKLGRMELLDGVGKLSGVGPKKAAALARLGVSTLYDLLTYYPRAYIDQSVVTPLAELSPESSATVSGLIVTANERRAARGMSVLTAVVSDGTGYLSMTWFNQPFLVKKLLPGRRVFATGKIGYAYGGHGGLAMTQMTMFELLAAGEDAASHGGVLPVYAATEALNQNILRRLMKEAMKAKPVMPEVIPE